MDAAKLILLAISCKYLVKFLDEMSELLLKLSKLVEF